MKYTLAELKEFYTIVPVKGFHKPGKHQASKKGYKHEKRPSHAIPGG